jgi:cytochrome c oxidase subunit 4
MSANATPTAAHGHPPPNIRLYLGIFGTLLVLTCLTVLVSYWHLPPTAAIAVGLTIAGVKAGLVIAFFMHLKGEHKLIYVFLGIMAFTMIGFFLIPTDQHMIRRLTTHTKVEAEHGEPEGATHEMPAGDETPKPAEGAETKP